MEIYEWNVLIQTLIGSLIGSALTLVATYYAHRLERKKDKEDENKLIFGFLQGIHDEVETLWDNYNEKVGTHVESLQDGSLSTIIGQPSRNTLLFIPKMLISSVVSMIMTYGNRLCPPTQKQKV